jgi:hypothetical protein
VLEQLDIYVQELVFQQVHKINNNKHKGEI